MSESFSNLWSDAAPRRLQASRDKSGTLRFPPYPHQSPLAALNETVEVETFGKVYSYCVIHPNPKTGLEPYALGYVDLPGPLRIFGRFSEGVVPAVGDRCEAVPDGALGYQFVLSGMH